MRTYHLRGDLPDADLSEVAARSAGMSGADIAALVRSARAAARQARRGLTQADLEVAPAAIRQPMSPQLRRRIAVHEAGHAVVAAACGLGQPKMIAITDGAGVMQHTWADLEGDEASLMAHLTLLMAGREAERLLLGTVSAGAGGPEESDLARASEIAAAMEVSYGLGTDGPLWRATRHCAVDVMADDLSLRARVRARLEVSEDRARAVLALNRETLERVAAALEQGSVVYGSELAGLLSGVASRDGSSVWEAHH